MAVETIILTRDQFDFIVDMNDAVKDAPALRQRLDTLCAHMLPEESRKQEKEEEKPQVNKTNKFDENRSQHKVMKTANFLSLFGVPSGLKFLTHDFDPDDNLTMEQMINNANYLLEKSGINGSIYALLNNFINGKGEWYDFRGKKHSMFLKSPELLAWCAQFPEFHPIRSSKYSNEIQAFRNTVRLSKPNLSSIVKDIVQQEKYLSGLKIDTQDLDKADFYTNVFSLRTIIKDVLVDIAQRDQTADVNIAYKREGSLEMGQKYEKCEIHICHLMSSANLFRVVTSKMQTDGGALSNLMTRCRSICDWAIEANFEEDGYKRWRILDSSHSCEVEDLEPSQVIGFTHVFTFYKKIS